jgi:DNA-binding XRE family transcriptional regulator
MIDARTVHDEMMRDDPEYRAEYEALEPEFAITRAMIRARSEAGMTQCDVAAALGVSQSAVAQIEAGRNVSLKSLHRYAKAVKHEVRIDLVPA